MDLPHRPGAAGPGEAGLTNTNLRQANLMDANLTGTDLKGAAVQHTLLLGARNVNLAGTTGTPKRFRGLGEVQDQRWELTSTWGKSGRAY